MQFLNWVAFCCLSFVAAAGGKQVVTIDEIVGVEPWLIDPSKTGKWTLAQCIVQCQRITFCKFGTRLTFSEGTPECHLSYTAGDTPRVCDASVLTCKGFRVERDEEEADSLLPNADDDYIQTLAPTPPPTIIHPPTPSPTRTPTTLPSFSPTPAPTSVPTPVPSMADKTLCNLLKVGGMTKSEDENGANGLYTRIAGDPDLSGVVYKQYEQPYTKRRNVRRGIAKHNHTIVDTGVFYLYYNSASSQWVIRKTLGKGFKSWEANYFYKDGQISMAEGPYESLSAESKSTWVLQSAGNPFTGAVGLRIKTKMYVGCLKAPDESHSAKDSEFKVFAHGELVTWIRTNDASIPLGTVGRVTKLYPDGRYAVKFRVKNKPVLVKNVKPSALQHALITTIGGY